MVEEEAVHQVHAFQHAVGRRTREDTSQDGSQGAPNAVDAEGVEGVVIAQHFLQVNDREERNDAGNDGHDHRTCWCDKSSRRSDDDETGDDARAETQHAGFAFENPFHKTPYEASGGSADECVGESVCRDRVGSEC